MGLITILGSGLFFFIIVAIFLLIVMFALHIKFKIENLEKDQEKTRKLTHSMAGIVKELSNDVIKLEKNANGNTVANLEEKTQNDIYTLFSSVNDLQLEVDALKYNNQQKLNEEDEDDDNNNENKKGEFKNKSKFFGKNAETDLLFSNLCNQQPNNSIHSFFSNIFNANNNLGIIGDTDNEDESNNNSNIEYDMNSIIDDFEFDKELLNSENNSPTKFQSPNVVKLDEEENENNVIVGKDDDDEDDEEENNNDDDENENDNRINDVDNVFDDFDKDFNEDIDAKLNLETNKEEKSQQIEVSLNEHEFYPQVVVQENTETNNEDIILQQNKETQQQETQQEINNGENQEQEQQTNKPQKITNVNKLSLPELRCLVVEHGLIENAVHLKKNQIIKLIDQHNKSIDEEK